MALSDEIRALRDRALADLDSAHDYYSDTKIAWQLVRNLISAGHTFINRNTLTGTVTSQADLATKARGYVAEQLNEATFQQFLAIFEHFLFEFLRLWLTAYPGSLGGKKLDFTGVGLSGQGLDHFARGEEGIERGPVRSTHRVV